MASKKTVSSTEPPDLGTLAGFAEALRSKDDFLLPEQPAGMPEMSWAAACFENCSLGIPLAMARGQELRLTDPERIAFGELVRRFSEPYAASADDRHRMFEAITFAELIEAHRVETVIAARPFAILKYRSGPNGGGGAESEVMHWHLKNLGSELSLAVHAVQSALSDSKPPRTNGDTRLFIVPEPFLRMLQRLEEASTLPWVGDQVANLLADAKAKALHEASWDALINFADDHGCVEIRLC
jgi:hypothetical protein